MWSIITILLPKNQEKVRRVEEKFRSHNPNDSSYNFTVSQNQVIYSYSDISMVEWCKQY